MSNFNDVREITNLEDVHKVAMPQGVFKESYTPLYQMLEVHYRCCRRQKKCTLVQALKPISFREIRTERSVTTCCTISQEVQHGRQGGSIWFLMFYVHQEMHLFISLRKH